MQKQKKWVKEPFGKDGKPLKRAFCQFCLDPIYQLFDAIMKEKKDVLEKNVKISWC